MYKKTYGHCSNFYGTQHPKGDALDGSLKGWRSEATVVKVYGPKRTKETPEERDNRLKKNASKDPKKRTSKKKGAITVAKLQEASKDEINADIHVTKVDLCITENAKSHHTDRFACVKRKDNPDLVLRRAASFEVKIQFDRTFDSKDHDLAFLMQSGEAPSPVKGTSYKFGLMNNPKGHAPVNQWCARLISSSNTTIIVQFHIPPRTIVGHWRLGIETVTVSKGEDATILMYEEPTDIKVLLNPWCQDDVCCMPDAKELDEYVLNSDGVLFKGNYRHQDCKPWFFGQFEEDILDICLHLLRKASNFDLSKKMSDPVQIARMLTTNVKSDCHQELIVGSSTGEYSDGTAPTAWSGSVRILRQFNETGSPVKYAQSWVYSGLVVTICRALGLPCRSVTNYNSAHATDGSVHLDRVWHMTSEGCSQGDDDSQGNTVWDFHVWNEVWMNRFDLPKGYGGWQAIDAMPQDPSRGISACGPASVKAILQGDCNLAYDTKFFFSEVNTQIVHWFHHEEDDVWEQGCIESDKTGLAIVTKVADGKPFDPNASVKSQDLKKTYKCGNGKEKEKAAKKIAGSSNKKLAKVEPDDFQFDIVDIENVMVGSDFDVKIKIKNVCKEKRTSTSTALTVVTKTYDGVVLDVVKHVDLGEVSLGSSEEKTLSTRVTVDDYLTKITEQTMMEAIVVARLPDIKKNFAYKEGFALRRPNIDIKIAGDAKRGATVDVTLTTKNPLKVPLTQCLLSVESGGYLGKTIDIGSIPASSDWKYTMKLTIPDSSSPCGFNATLDSKELPDLVGGCSIVCA